MKLQQLQNERYKEGVVFMNIKITGKELKATEAIKEYVEKKCERLQKYTKHIIKEISKDIFSGDINIQPFYMNKKTPCEYCSYKTICNFDRKLEGNDYRYIKNLSKDYVLEEIKGR